MPARTLDAIEARATGLELAVGVPTFDRANISAVLPLVNQRVFMSYIAPPANMTCTRIRTYSGTTAAATPTGIYLGVYREETNGDLTLLEQTANGAGTIYTAPDTAYEPVLQTSVALIAGKRYTLAVLVAAIGMPSVPATVNNVPQNLEDLRFPYRSTRTSSDGYDVAGDRFGKRIFQRGHCLPGGAPVTDTFGTGMFGAGTFGAIYAWNPSDPWPSTLIGGAQAPAWGGYIRFWIRAGLAPGYPFPYRRARTRPSRRRQRAHRCRGAPTCARPTPSGYGLTSRATRSTWRSPAARSSGQGIFSKADAATLIVTFRDPDGKYDPLNNRSPYAYGGRSRLVPGTPIEAFAEVVDANTATASTRHWLFTGTADSWGEDWTPHASQAASEARGHRRNQTVRRGSTDPSNAEQGAGDTTSQRVERIVQFTIGAAPSSMTVTAPSRSKRPRSRNRRGSSSTARLTTSSATSTSRRTGALRWVNRAMWFAPTAPVLELGCGLTGSYDVLVDAHPSTLDTQMRNAVYAARTDGTTQTAYRHELANPVRQSTTTSAPTSGSRPIPKPVSGRRRCSRSTPTRR